MNINSIPILCWLISAVVFTSMAVPFWAVWTTCGIGAKYFSFLPQVYQTPPFWDCVGLFMVLSIITSMVPKFSQVTQMQGND